MQTADTRANSPATIQTRVCRVLALALVAYLLASVAGFYQSDIGFTAFIGFSGSHEYEVPAMEGVPHAHMGGGYDGQFYAQLALVPLLQEPAINRALDNAPYRARRILFSWTAYAAGLGKPAWVLQAYALQNVVCWLFLAWVLCRWIPPDNPRRLALWVACLFSHGLLASVRLALTDGPSMLLLACGALVAERGRVWATSAIVGLSALGRETNLFGLSMLPRPRTPLQWASTVGAVLLAIAPFLLWQDYLFSIYRRMTFANQNQLAMPLGAFIHKWHLTTRGVMREGVGSPHMLSLIATAGLTAQAVYLLTAFRAHRRSVWWRLALPYVALMLVLDFVVWGGHPGAATRVLLPITVAFNVLLNAEASPRFSIWYVLANAALWYSPDVLRS